ncbi:MAG TPA: molybdopterin-binding protein [Candidatus Binatia bacterium]|nr:molybdopterin-binding protein [Candidatus Binatia bacterium]
MFRKGRALQPEDIARLRELGRRTVYVAELEADDVDEDTAARRVAERLYGEHFRLSGPSTGRANIYTTERGIMRVDTQRLMRINECDGITLATLRNNTAVSADKIAATLKILPYAVPLTVVTAAETIAAGDDPLLRIDLLRARRVSLILSGSPSARERIVPSFESALAERLKALGATIATVDFVSLDEEQDEANLAEVIRRRVREGAQLVILAGETAIMDRHDIAPRAVERAGGTVIAFGAPVDPGNLLMLAELDDVPVMGAPGCARSPKDNIVDLVLPRLLVGDRLTKRDITALAHGGLLEDVPERPSPRSRLS